MRQQGKSMYQDLEFMRKLKECKGGENACIAMKDRNIWISVTVTKPGAHENPEIFIDEFDDICEN